jgi:hypothetical protein
MVDDRAVLAENINRRLTVARIIEDVVHGDDRWALKFAGEILETSVEVDASGVTFRATWTATENHLSEAIPHWVGICQNGTLVWTFDTPPWHVKAGDDVELRTRLNAGDTALV